MAETCTCSLGADECDGQFGVFWPLQDGGSCAVRPCQRPATSTAGWPYNDKVQCAKRIMEAVDTYHERPDALNRAALRSVVLTELDEYAAGVATGGDGQS